LPGAAGQGAPAYNKPMTQAVSAVSESDSMASSSDNIDGLKKLLDY